MSDGWLNADKYERVPITSCTGPGTMVEGYAWKFVLHSTESPPGSIDGVVSLFKAQPCYTPHFTIDPMSSNRRVQHIPWQWSAAALRPGAGGYETNRGRAVQMEVCGYAQQAPGWSDDALFQIADVIADVIADGCPIDPDNISDSTGLSGTLATTTAPQRMAWEAWRLFDGITAHVFVPNNDHWDCGRLDSNKLHGFVRDILAGQGHVVVPQPSPEPLPTPPANPTVGYLQKGMTGGIIEVLQKLLQGLGYNVGPSGADGVFGFATETAVKQFQADHGLVVDGIFGPASRAAMQAAYEALNHPVPPPPPPPDAGFPAWPGRFLLLATPLVTGGDVRTWQARMAARGWRIDADGAYGPQSQQVCLAFQREKGLEADGIVGRQAWDAAWTAPVS